MTTTPRGIDRLVAGVGQRLTEMAAATPPAHDCRLSGDEVRLSGCRYGCKVFRCRVCGAEQEVHNPLYGCRGAR